MNTLYSPTSEIMDISDFLDRYRTFARSHELAQAEKFQIKFRHLRTQFQVVKQQALEEARTEAPTFNIFRILGLAHYEVRTHSAFLAHLLNPEQSHGQQTLFLWEFLSYVHSKFDLFLYSYEEITNTLWLVDTELKTVKGNLDIVLRCPDLGFICVIENKIFAGEQKNQIRRYADWLETQEENYPEQVLFYLTRAGDISYTHKGATYEILSYRKDIFAILKNTLDRIAAARVKETIYQYMQLIKRL
ncbi:MAG: PD-(D/E)XK nuclease family protein [Anaerolineales bacterium]|nr:PD-(D/E)XK nuclease family protein [Anaerolineales bacterium]